MKRQLFIFLLLFISAIWIDIKPLDLKKLQSDEIRVTIKGAVETEGEISLPLYATINEALDQIVLKENADISTLNPNTILKDADVLNIPYQKEENELARISINTATLEELCTLSGIGETTAQRIIDYRNTNGLFQTIEDLMNVKGIGEAKFEKIRDSITL